MSGARRRVLILTQDVVGPRMAGPAIRAFELARMLAQNHEVQLGTRHLPERAGDGFAVDQYTAGTIERMVAAADVVVTFGSVLRDHPHIARDTVVVADLYDPAPFEALVMYQDEADEGRRDAIHEESLAILLAQLHHADLFLCASERQRDLVVGMLTAAGRVNPRTFDADPAFDSLVQVVPFGLPNKPPEASGDHPLRKRIEGSGPTDLVVFWGGGIYEWLDPLTLIEAVARIELSVKLVFPGMTHPTPEVPTMRMANRARELADRLGVVGERVFFGEGWVNYDERGDFLLDADAGASLHRHHIETTYAFRTRMLDYLWAGLPVLCSSGDSFADLARSNDLGEVVDVGDVAGVERALLCLARAERRATCSANARALAEKYTWDRVAEPLIEFCADPKFAADRADPARRRKAIAPSAMRLLATAARARLRGTPRR